ncbi:hypothetical protein ABIB94_009413 [Bradyrhizobium sp. JR7.2]|uniref:AbiV family abortive infection protein n=2 Tax=Bradyrhizobium TaxID=374 RepID=A0ABY3R122_9BRAD|nr:MULTISPECIES: hypothetical protein [Bradyrhizobium]UFW91807.1 hypothetical protein BjapCC829_46085 [Bradyrhizobium japonicum]WFU00330.1 hypothetical protein QA633_46845 [Bradyrhizobium barranii]
MTSDQTAADAEFIIQAAPRLSSIATLASMSFGLGEGASEAIRHAQGNAKYPQEWHQAALGFQDGTLMMAVVRTCILLDSDEKTVSFQGVYKRLKEPETQRALIQKVFGEYEEFQSMFGSSPTQMVADFLSIYQEIDWGIHSTLIHFRNFGVVHLLDRKNWKSIKYGEMRDLILLVGRLSDKLTELCRSSVPPIASLVKEWREYGLQALARP